MFQRSDGIRVITGRRGRRGLAGARFDVRHLFVDTFPYQYEVVAKEVRRRRPDAIMVDAPFTGAIPIVIGGPGWTGHNPPVLAVGVSPLLLSSRDAAPFGSALPPMRGPVGHARNAVLNLVTERVFFASHQRSVNRLLKEHAGAPPLGFYGGPTWTPGDPSCSSPRARSTSQIWIVSSAPRSADLSTTTSSSSRQQADLPPLSQRRDSGIRASWLIFSMSMMLGIVHPAAQIMAPYLTMRVTTAPPDGIITLSLQAIFFAFFLPNFASLGSVLPFVAMVFMAAGMSNGTVHPPLITAAAMGSMAFGKIWSVTGAAYMLGMAVGAPIWGLFYDPPTKSYTVGFMLAPVALVIFVVGSVIGMNAGKRRHMALYEEELAAWEASQRSAAVPAS